MKLQTYTKTVQAAKIEMICPGHESLGARLTLDNGDVTFVGVEYMDLYKPSPGDYYVVENGYAKHERRAVFECDYETT